MRRALAEELRRSPRIDVVGVLDDLDAVPAGARATVMVLDVSSEHPIDGVLSTRELDVLRCIARGLTNAGIAGELYVSTETVKTHVRNLLRKLGVTDRMAAVARATSAGLLGDPGEPTCWTELDAAGRSPQVAGPGPR